MSIADQIISKAYKQVGIKRVPTTRPAAPPSNMTADIINRAYADYAKSDLAGEEQDAVRSRLATWGPSANRGGLLRQVETGLDAPSRARFYKLATRHWLGSHWDVDDEPEFGRSMFTQLPADPAGQSQIDVERVLGDLPDSDWPQFMPFIEQLMQEPSMSGERTEYGIPVEYMGGKATERQYRRLPKDISPTVLQEWVRNPDVRRAALMDPTALRGVQEIGAPSKEGKAFAGEIRKRVAALEMVQFQQQEEQRKKGTVWAAADTAISAVFARTDTPAAMARRRSLRELQGEHAALKESPNLADRLLATSLEGPLAYIAKGEVAPSDIMVQSAFDMALLHIPDWLVDVASGGKEGAVQEAVTPEQMSATGMGRLLGLIVPYSMAGKIFSLGRGVADVAMRKFLLAVGKRYPRMALGVIRFARNPLGSRVLGALTNIPRVQGGVAAINLLEPPTPAELKRLGARGGDALDLIWERTIRAVEVVVRPSPELLALAGFMGAWRGVKISPRDVRILRIAQWRLSQVARQNFTQLSSAEQAALVQQNVAWLRAEAALSTETILNRAAEQKAVLGRYRELRAGADPVPAQTAMAQAQYEIILRPRIAAVNEALGQVTELPTQQLALYHALTKSNGSTQAIFKMAKQLKLGTQRGLGKKAQVVFDQQTQYNLARAAENYRNAVGRAPQGAILPDNPLFQDLLWQTTKGAARLRPPPVVRQVSGAAQRGAGPPTPGVREAGVETGEGARGLMRADARVAADEVAAGALAAGRARVGLAPQAPPAIPEVSAAATAQLGAAAELAKPPTVTPPAPVPAAQPAEAAPAPPPAKEVPKVAPKPVTPAQRRSEAIRAGRTAGKLRKDVLEWGRRTLGEEAVTAEGEAEVAWTYTDEQGTERNFDVRFRGAIPTELKEPLEGMTYLRSRLRPNMGWTARGADVLGDLGQDEYIRRLKAIFEGKERRAGEALEHIRQEAEERGAAGVVLKVDQVRALREGEGEVEFVKPTDLYKGDKFESSGVEYEVTERRQNSIVIQNDVEGGVGLDEMIAIDKGTLKQPADRPTPAEAAKALQARERPKGAGPEVASYLGDRYTPTHAADVAARRIRRLKVADTLAGVTPEEVAANLETADRLIQHYTEKSPKRARVVFIPKLAAEEVAVGDLLKDPRVPAEDLKRGIAEGHGLKYPSPEATAFLEEEATNGRTYATQGKTRDLAPGAKGERRYAVRVYPDAAADTPLHEAGEVLWYEGFRGGGAKDHEAFARWFAAEVAAGRLPKIAITKALARAKPGGPAYQVTVYHGGGAMFAAEEGAPLGKFREKFIGTGEGKVSPAEAARVGGKHVGMIAWGGYAAGAKGLGRHYAMTIGEGPEIHITGLADGYQSGVVIQFHLAGLLKLAEPQSNAGWDRAQADLLREMDETYERNKRSPFEPGTALRRRMDAYMYDFEHVRAAIAAAQPIDIQSKFRRHLYEVELWPGKQEVLLDWRKPVPEKQFRAIEVQYAQDHPGEPLREALRGMAGDEPTGAHLYGLLSQSLGSDKLASKFLLRAGIDGVRYEAADAGYNYVVFDPENQMRIVGRTAFAVVARGPQERFDRAIAAGNANVAADSLLAFALARKPGGGTFYGRWRFLLPAGEKPSLSAAYLAGAKQAAQTAKEAVAWFAEQAKGLGPHAEITQFATMLNQFVRLAGARTPAQIQKAVAAGDALIDRIRERVRLNAARKDFKSLSKAIHTTDMASPQKERAMALLDAIQRSAPTQKSLDRIQAKLTAAAAHPEWRNPESPNYNPLFDKVARAAEQRLRRTPIAGLDAEAIEGINAFLGTLKSLSDMKKRIQLRRRMVELAVAGEQSAKDIKAARKASKVAEFEWATRQVPKPVGGVRKAIANQMHGPGRVLLALAGNEDSPLYQATEQVVLGTLAEHRMYGEFEMGMRGAIREALGKDWTAKLRRISAAVAGKNPDKFAQGNGIDIDFGPGATIGGKPAGKTLWAPAEFMKWYWFCLDPEHIPQLLHSSKHGGGWVPSHRQTAKPLAFTLPAINRGRQIMRREYPELAKIVQAAFDYMNTKEHREVMNAGIRKHYGFNLLTRDRYSPGRRSLVQEQRQVRGPAYFMQRVMEDVGFLKPRTGGARPFMGGDFFSELYGHMQAFSHVAANTVPLNNLRALLGNPDLNKAAQDAGRTDVLSYLSQYVRDIEGVDPVRMTGIEKGMRSWLRRFRSGALMFNWAVSLKQVLSYAYVPFVVPARHWGHWAKATLLTPAKSRRLQREMEAESQYFRHRYERGMASSMSMLPSGDGLYRSIVGSGRGGFTRAGYWPIRRFDQLAIRRVWEFSKLVVEADRPSLEPGSREYWDAVEEQAFWVTGMSQPTGDVAFRGEIQRKAMQQPAWAIPTMFTSQRGKVFTFLGTAVSRMRRKLRQIENGEGMPDGMKPGTAAAKAWQLKQRAKVLAELALLTLLLTGSLVTLAQINRLRGWEYRGMPEGESATAAGDIAAGAVENLIGVFPVGGGTISGAVRAARTMIQTGKPAEVYDDPIVRVANAGLRTAWATSKAVGTIDIDDPQKAKAARLKNIEKALSNFQDLAGSTIGWPTAPYKTGRGIIKHGMPGQGQPRGYWYKRVTESLMAGDVGRASDAVVMLEELDTKPEHLQAVLSRRWKSLGEKGRAAADELIPQIEARILGPTIVRIVGPGFLKLTAKEQNKLWRRLHSVGIANRAKALDLYLSWIFEDGRIRDVSDAMDRARRALARRWRGPPRPD